MKWFNDCKTLEEVKAAYKKLAKQYHPDLGGDTATMQAINTEYTFACAKTIKGANLSDEQTENEMRFSEAYRKAIEQVIHLEGITVELVGMWLWATGQTYFFRKQLKSAGFFFAPKKQAWYFRTDEYRVNKSSGKSLEQIRRKYGSEVLTGDKPKQNHLHN
jgi:hypothetical protein